jgi:hypothetical protein
VEIISPNGDVLLTVVGEDGIPLKRYQNGPPSWTSQLPASQDYYLHAVSVGPATEYTLRVQIEPLAESSGERIEFAPGETTIQRSGALPAGGFTDYVLSGSAGQGLHVQTVGYGAPVSFVVRSPGGATWSGEPLPAGAYIYALQVVLPDDGEYVITLSVPATAGAAQYDVVFTAVDASAIQTTPVPNEPAERVEFEPGGISAERSGLMPSGWGIKQYVLAASVGQTFAMDVRSDGTPLNVTVEGPSGNRWLPEMTPTEDTQVIHYQMVLPETGDYVISLNKPDHTPSTNYTVSFTIQ